ncbi:MAG: hypothetical protein AAFS03_12435, partial [Pseudomonadota bacterium]
ACNCNEAKCAGMPDSLRGGAQVIEDARQATGGLVSEFPAGGTLRGTVVYLGQAEYQGRQRHFAMTAGHVAHGMLHSAAEWQQQADAMAKRKPFVMDWQVDRSAPQACPEDSAILWPGKIAATCGEVVEARWRFADYSERATEDYAILTLDLGGTPKRGLRLLPASQEPQSYEEHIAFGGPDWNQNAAKVSACQFERNGSELFRQSLATAVGDIAGFDSSKIQFDVEYCLPFPEPVVPGWSGGTACYNRGCLGVISGEMMHADRSGAVFIQRYNKIPLLNELGFLRD